MEAHLFYGIGDNEIQVDSFDKKLNKEILKLQKKKPDAVYIIYDDEAPAFLRAAVRMTNFTVSVHETNKKELTEAQRTARSENGKKHKDNLLNRKGGEKID